MAGRWIRVPLLAALVGMVLSVAGCAREEIREPKPVEPLMPMTTPWPPTPPDETP